MNKPREGFSDRLEIKSPNTKELENAMRNELISILCDFWNKNKENFNERDGNATQDFGWRMNCNLYENFVDRHRDDSDWERRRVLDPFHCTPSLLAELYAANTS